MDLQDLTGRIKDFFEGRQMKKDLNGVSFDKLCKLFEERGIKYTVSGKSRIYSFAPPSGKVVLTETATGYDIEVLKNGKTK